MPLSPCVLRLSVSDVKRTGCPECQQVDSAVGIWTGLSRVLMPGSRLACAIAGEPLLLRPNLCSRKPAPNTGTPRTGPFRGPRTLRYHVLPLWILDKNMLDEDEARLRFRINGEKSFTCLPTALAVALLTNLEASE